MEYDLLTTVGVRFRDVPSTIGWDGVALIARHLPVDSAVGREVDSEAYLFSTDIKRAQIAADTFDAINDLLYAFLCANSKSKPSKPKPYPTPWSKGKTDERKIGEGAIPVSDFEKWYYGDDEEGE